MEKDYLVLQARISFSSLRQWNDDDHDELAESVIVGRIMKAAASPVETPWLWTSAFGHHEDRAPTHGYAATRDAAMSALAKSCRREVKALG
jgi:hypothetical protein